MKDIIVYDMLIWNVNSKPKTKFRYLEIGIDRRRAVNIWILVTISTGEITVGCDYISGGYFITDSSGDDAIYNVGYAHVACSAFSPHQVGPFVGYE